MRGLLPAILILLMLSSLHARHMRFMQNGKPAKVGFTVSISDKSYEPFADSIASQLVGRFLAYSQDRGDFALVKPGETSDYTFYLAITRGHIIPYDQQMTLDQKRRGIEHKYEKINDSLANNYIAPSGASITAANVIGNVVLNAALAPLGYAAILIVKDPGSPTVAPDENDKSALDSTYAHAYIEYSARLENRQKKVLWKKNRGLEKFTLFYLVPESEQIKVLVRNIVLKIDGKMPLFQTIRNH
jgi:hypothetical protein